MKTLINLALLSLSKMAQLTQEEVKERLKNLTPEQMQELIKQQCVFCKIVAGEIPAYKIYEDANFLAFLDVNPACAGHTLVIPKAHVSVLPQMPDQLAAGIFILVRELAGKIFEATNAEGITVLQRNGQVAGQVVPHVHIHIVPRYADDQVQDGWEPKKLSEEQFKEAQRKIVEALSKLAPKDTSERATSAPHQAASSQHISESNVSHISGSKAEGERKEEIKEPKKKKRLPQVKPRLP